MIRKSNCAAAVLMALGVLVTSQASAACNEEAAANVRSSNLDDKGKLNMLRSLGCDTADLAKKIDADFQAGLERNKVRNEQAAAKEKAEREAKQKKTQDEWDARIAEDNAKRDAFDQTMADKCGEYPMELKIGMSEKLLKMGCTGQADLVGEDQNARVYRTYGALVSVYKGKVVRWVRQ